MLLVTLFDYVSIYARHVKGAHDFLIEVNPRHVSYYERLLRFELAGTQRPCPRVHGAPAVLLRLDLALVEREVRRVAGRRAAAGERSLYPYFIPSSEEPALARDLAYHHGAMSADDAEYFGVRQLAKA
jgi:hypothetical protein